MSAAAKGKQPQPPPPGTEGGVDLATLFYSVLVHTVSHKDVYVTLEGRAGSECDAVARPAFSSFRSTTGRLLEELLAQRAEGGLERVFFSSERTERAVIPVGYRPRRPVEFEDWADFRVKSRFREEVADRPRVTGVYFPLQAIILPRWLAISDGKAAEGQRLLFLVSGSGMPWNRGHDAEANSTARCAEMLRDLFIAEFYPEVRAEVVNLAARNIFTYDANVRFVTEELRPRIDRLRATLAQHFYEFWEQRMHVTLSLSGGVPAHVSSISASLRSYRPDCLHIWQLKSFWHSWPTAQLREDELEWHPFEKLEVAPAKPAAEVTDDDVAGLVAEMRRHKIEFEAVRDSGRYHELDLFWLRKSKKPVLSVLMVRKRGESGAKYYRGVNLEVSMPTGSLCSERNAVGSALASDPALTRKDMQMIAVLSLPLTLSAKRPFVPPPPAASSSALNLLAAGAGAAEVAGRHRRTYTPALETTAEPAPLALASSASSSSAALAAAAAAASRESSDSDASSDDDGDGGAGAAAGVPRSASALRPHPRGGTPQSYRSAANLHSATGSPMLRSAPGSPRGSRVEDLNPINPCGACNEWLKKIAEVNPDFRVVTFTSADMDGVYVKSVARA